MHPSLKFGFHLVQFRLQPFADRLPQHRKPSIASFLYADMRKAKKVERLRFPFSTPLSLVDRERTKFQQPRFLGVQFQVELLHSFREFCPKLIGIRFLWNPSTISSAKRTMITSPCARFRRHAWTHRSNT